MDVYNLYHLETAEHEGMICARTLSHAAEIAESLLETVLSVTAYDRVTCELQQHGLLYYWSKNK